MCFFVKLLRAAADKQEIQGKKGAESCDGVAERANHWRAAAECV